MLLPNSIKIGEIEMQGDGSEIEVFHVLTSFYWRYDSGGMIVFH